MRSDSLAQSEAAGQVSGQRNAFAAQRASRSMIRSLTALTNEIRIPDGTRANGRAVGPGDRSAAPFPGPPFRFGPGYENDWPLAPESQ